MPLITVANGRIVRCASLGAGYRPGTDHGAGEAHDTGEALDAGEERTEPKTTSDRGHFSSGLTALDGLAPPGGWALGAVHELLYGGERTTPARPADGTLPLSAALFWARCALAAGCQPGKAVVLVDLDIYPPALARLGLPLRQVILLRTGDDRQRVWTLAECLRSSAVAAVVAPVHRLGRIHARRLQLAAERGGGVGLWLRPADDPSPYAAATRWLTLPYGTAAQYGAALPGEWPDCCTEGARGGALMAHEGARWRQRWMLRLVHGHGGRVGDTALLEVDRDGRFSASPAPAVDVPAAQSVFHRPAHASVA